MTEIAAHNPHAWFPIERSVDEIVDATPDNRMVGYPYTKYMVSIMDVDMAARRAARAATRRPTGSDVPAERRVYLRGWCYATDATYVAEHDELYGSPAMAAAAAEADGACRDRRRRRRAPRRLLVLRQLGELRPGRARPRRRRPPRRHRHRRAARTTAARAATT